MATVLLLLDAFRSSYISEKNTPFLNKISKEGFYCPSVEQSYGFCERTEILTGLIGKESGFFTAIGYDPLNSPFKNLKGLYLLEIIENLLLYFLRLFPSKYASKAQKKIRYYISFYFKKKGIKMPSYLIPISWLKYFSLTEDQHDHRNSNVFKVKSILDLITENNMRYFYESFSFLANDVKYHSDSERFDAVINDLKRDKKDFYLVYVSASDFYGHLFGPESIEFNKIINKLDSDLMKFISLFEKSENGSNYIILGDHGMTSVINKINLESEIKNIVKRKKFKLGKDVIYFLDSTIVRIWFLNEKAKTELLDDLYQSSTFFSNNGEWLNLQKAIEYNIPWPDKRYGDCIWLAKSGNLVFPDFFHSFEPCKGMHGYDPKLDDSKGMCIVWNNMKNPITIDEMPLSNVYNILKNLLKL
jgi:predicted AlkP superfamily pyrophosphatase or phosphodiesterase